MSRAATVRALELASIGRSYVLAELRRARVDALLVEYLRSVP